MTDTRESEADTAIIAEVLALIDQGLMHLQHRELVSTDEMSDLLLDVRTLLAASEPVSVN